MPHNAGSRTVVLFGAGTGARLWLERHKSKDDEYVVVDNNSKLHGSNFGAIPILNPAELTQLDFKQVLILVSDLASVIPQLIDLGLPEEALVVPAKAEFSPQPFLTPSARAHGLYCIREMVKFASLSGLKPVVEMGAALGLYRDGDLIHWDNGAEISVPPADGPAFENLHHKILASSLFREVVRSETANGPQLLFRSRQGDVILAVYTRTKGRDGLLSLAEKAEFLNVEADVLWPPRMYTVGDFDYPLPNRIKEYLEGIYGRDWSTPRRDFKYSEYAQNRAQ